MTRDTGKLFAPSLMRAVKERFLHVDQDAAGRERLYFDNAGGAFRLKAAIDCFTHVDAIPDNTERHHAAAVELQDVQAQGVADLRTILNATGGSVFASLTASGAMFDVVRAIAENVPGTNMVTTVLEHPSAFDAMSLYAERFGKELRVARSNPATGGVDVDEIVGLVDADTCLLNVIFASNISGAKLEIEEIVRRARLIKPGLYIVVDAVQHAPHGIIDLQKTPVDGINIAPYKFFGCRGSGFAWLSDRAAKLPHHKLAAKKQDVWDLGSSAPWQFAVVTAIVDYVCWLGGEAPTARGETGRRQQFVKGMEVIGLHERALLQRLLDGGDTPGLRRMERVRVFMDHNDLSKRDLILAIGFDDLDCTEAVREYEKRGVIVYERVSSSLYSKRMLESLGLAGAVRVSPLHCNSEADVDRFLAVTGEICEKFAPARCHAASRWPTTGDIDVPSPAHSSDNPCMSTTNVPLLSSHELIDLGLQAASAPPCTQCGALVCAGWESMPGSFERARLVRIGTLRFEDVEEPILREHHPRGTHGWSADAPIAPAYFPYNRCDVWQCGACPRIYLRYTEYGGYYEDERIRALDPTLVDDTPA